MKDVKNEGMPKYPYYFSDAGSVAQAMRNALAAAGVDEQSDDSAEL